MANKLAAVTGNFLTAGTWVTGNTGVNALLISTSTGVTALTTGNLDSATFVPAAQASQYIAVRLGARAAGSPSNTMTIKLRNSTTGTDIWTFVINVSDLPACTTTDDCGGWIIFKAAAAHTPNGTDNYVVRATLSSTSTAVSLCTNGTANNWQRQLFQTATGAPAAGDDILHGGIWDTTNPAVKTDVDVTMNETATTDYGSNTNAYRTAAYNICKGGTLTFSTSINTVLRLSGFLVVYSVGTLKTGASGAVIARGNTAVLELDPTADQQMGITIKNGGTWLGAGATRIAGANTTFALLNANAAIAATTLTVDRQMAAANGDTVVLGSTSGTVADVETKTLNADAGATSLTLSAGLTNAHGGVMPAQGEVFVLDRNVMVRTTDSTKRSVITCEVGSIVNWSWMSIQYMGHAAAKNSFNGNNTTLDRVVVRDSTDGISFGSTGTMTGLSITELLAYNTGNNAFGSCVVIGASVSAGVIDGLFVVGPTGSPQSGLVFTAPTSLPLATVTNVRITSCGNTFIRFLAGDYLGTTVDNLNCHGNGGQFTFAAGSYNLNFTNFYVWRNRASFGQITEGVSDVTFTTGAIFGGSNINANLRTSGFGIVLNNITIASDATGTRYGILMAGATEIFLNNCTLGSAVSPYAAHSVNDIYSNAVRTYFRVNCRGCTFAGTDSVIGTASSYISKDNGTTRNTTLNPVTGTVAREATTVDVAPSIKMTPISALYKLTTAASLGGEGFLIPVDNGSTPTIAVKVYVDGAYNGAAPRLILKANAALGVLTDTVLGTWAGSTGVLVTVSGAAPTATDAGTYEVVVDCDGTAGFVVVDTLSVTGASIKAPGGLDFFMDGLCVAMVANAAGGAGSVGERAHVSIS